MLTKNTGWHHHAQEIVGLCEDVLSATKGMNKESFVSRQEVYDVTLENIRLIGCAVYKLPTGVFRIYPQVDWRGLMSVRYAMEQSNGFWDVKSRFFWRLIQQTLPLLLSTLQDVLDKTSKETVLEKKRA